MSIRELMFGALSCVSPSGNMGPHADGRAVVYNIKPARLLFGSRDCAEIPSRCGVCLESLSLNSSWPHLPFAVHRTTHAVHFSCYVEYAQQRAGLSAPWGCPICSDACDSAVGAMFVDLAMRVAGEVVLSSEERLTWRVCKVLAYGQQPYFAASKLRCSDDAANNRLALLPMYNKCPKVYIPSPCEAGVSAERLVKHLLEDVEEKALCGHNRIEIHTTTSPNERKVIAELLLILQSIAESVPALQSKVWHMAVAALFATLIECEQRCARQGVDSSGDLRTRYGCTDHDCEALTRLAIDEQQFGWLRYAVPCVPSRYIAGVIRENGARLGTSAVTAMLSVATDFDNDFLKFLAEQGLLSCIPLAKVPGIVQRYLAKNQAALAKDVLFAQPLALLQDMPVDEYQALLTCNDRLIQLYLRLFPPRAIAAQPLAVAEYAQLIDDACEAFGKHALCPKIVAASPRAIHLLPLLIDIEQWSKTQTMDVICALAANDSLMRAQIDPAVRRELKTLLMSYQNVFKEVIAASKPFGDAYTSLLQLSQEPKSIK